MKVSWTQKGRQRLQQLYDYISTDQPDNALNYVDKISMPLQMQPRSGKVVEKNSLYTIENRALLGYIAPINN